MIRKEGKLVHNGEIFNIEEELKVLDSEIEEKSLDLRKKFEDLLSVVEDLNIYNPCDYLSQVKSGFLDNRATVLRKYSQRIADNIEDLELLSKKKKETGQKLIDKKKFYGVE